MTVPSLLAYVDKNGDNRKFRDGREGRVEFLSEYANCLRTSARRCAYQGRRGTAQTFLFFYCVIPVYVTFYFRDAALVYIG